MKYKLDFTSPLRDFKDEIVNPEQKLCDILANQISFAQSQDFAKFSIFAYDLFKTGVLILDSADTDLLYKWIVANNNFVNLLKHRLVEVVNNKTEVV